MTDTPSLQTAQNNIPPGMIDLGVGDPQFDLLPLERLQRAAAQHFAAGDRAFLQYGLEAGDGYLRAALAGFLSGEYQCPVEAGNLFITSGASGGLDLICTLFTRPGDVIFVEEPSYFLALRIFADHGLRPVALPMDGYGLSIDALEDELKRVRPALLYTVPTFQNPSSLTLSLERRKKLADLGRKHGFLIIADEVYHLLYYGDSPPAPLAAFSGEENVLSLGSFSKILAPGLRLGWIQAHPRRVAQLAGSGLLDSGGGMNPFTSAIVRGLVEDGGLRENIAALKAVYAERARAMAAGLQRHLPGASYRMPQGGFFFWVRLPGGLDAQELLPTAARLNVRYRPGVRFSSRGGLNDYLRIGFSFYPSEQIEAGLMRLGQAVQAQSGVSGR